MCIRDSKERCRPCPVGGAGRHITLRAPIVIQHLCFARRSLKACGPTVKQILQQGTARGIRG
eukprot:6361193-Alexandrium_andersonii.AAC.1